MLPHLPGICYLTCQEFVTSPARNLLPHLPGICYLTCQEFVTSPARNLLPHLPGICYLTCQEFVTSPAHQMVKTLRSVLLPAFLWSISQMFSIAFPVNRTFILLLPIFQISYYYTSLPVTGQFLAYANFYSGICLKWTQSKTKFQSNWNQSSEMGIGFTLLESSNLISLTNFCIPMNLCR